MSILIKGMDMPKNCYECNMNYDSYRCRGTGDLFGDADLHYRLDKCPLIEISKPSDAIAYAMEEDAKKCLDLLKSIYAEEDDDGDTN